MMPIREILARLRDRIQRDRLGEELEEELRYHRSLLDRDRPPGRSLGNVTYYREEARAMWSLGVVDDLWQDVRYAARVLRRDRGFTAAVMLTLALGIGANTAVFSIVNAVLLRPLPYREPDRLISVWLSPAASPNDRNPTSLPDLRDWQRDATMLDGIAGYAFNRFDLSGPEGDEQARAILATGTLYEVLGATPLLGRLPRPDEENAPVVAISYRLWHQRFGGDQHVLGRQLVMNHQPYTIVGVMPPGFHYPGPDIDLWSSLYSIISSPNDNGPNLWVTSRSLRGYRVLARLAPGIDAHRAESALNAIEHRLAVTFPEVDGGLNVHVRSVNEEAVSGIARGLWTVFGAAALILLLSCVNVAHLLLERISSRMRELALRRALGAHRNRVLRQLATESVLLGLLGGAAGIGVAFGAMRALLRLAPPDIPRLENVAIDLPTLGFAVAASLAAATIFGIAPVAFGWSSEVHETLRAQGKGATDGMHGQRTRALLTTLEVAFAVVILIAAGLVLRSFKELTSSNLGVEPNGIAVTQLTVLGARYRSNDVKVRTVEQVLANVRAIPGVTAAGASTSMPPTRIQEIEGFSIVGEPDPAPGHEPTAIYVPATPGFLSALQIPVRTGRDFDARDNAASPSVVIISRELARRHFSRIDPIGHQLRIAGVTRTIVGVAGDAPYEGVGTPIEAVMYVPFAQSPFPGVWLAIRTTTPPSALAKPLRDAFHRVDPDLATRPPQPLDALVSESIVRPRFQTWLLGTFGGLALVLASIGIYGVVAFGVTQRRSELGIRLALGAPKRSVMAAVLRGGMPPVIYGLLVGLAVAYEGSRLVAGLLFGISRTDPVTFAAVPLLLLTTALVAAYLPAHRASQVDPLVAIRGD
jgi:putative ABC transport system permease protein